MPATTRRDRPHTFSMQHRLALPGKQAAFGAGDGSDDGFEQSFADIAFSSLRSSAPGLLDYLVGFQLLERDEEDNRAAGMFGFKAGPTWLYAPVFFVNGELEGSELLYVKNWDQFVPLKENWLNHILQRRPSVLGDQVARNQTSLGIRQPRLFQLRDSPLKYASALPDWAMPGAAAFARTVLNPLHPPAEGEALLPRFLKAAGLPALEKLLGCCRAMPKLARAVERYHGLKKLASDVLTHLRKDRGVLAQPPAVKQAAAPAKLTVITYSMSMDTRGFGPEEKEKLQKYRYLVRDQRTDSSKLYRLDSTLKLSNPTETGIYDVLVKPGKFERCLVVYKPYSTAGVKDFVTVIRLASPRAWMNIHPAHVWCRYPESDDEDVNYKKWLAKQPEGSLSEDRGATQILLGPVAATVPFSVRFADSTHNGHEVYRIYAHDHPERGRPRSHGGFTPHNSIYNEGTEHSYVDGRGERLHLVDRPGAAIRATGQDLYVPTGFKVLRLREDDYGCGSAPEPIVPGTGADIRELIFNKTAALEVKRHAVDDFLINDHPFDRPHAVAYLVRDVGLREKAALDVLDEALAKRHVEYRVKLAYPEYDLQQSAPVAPSLPEPLANSGGFPGFEPNMATQLMGPQQERIRSDPRYEDPGVYTPYSPVRQDWDAMQTALQASQSGQKDVFDTAVVGGLLRTSRPESMIDDGVKQMRKTLDQLGRKLFSLYWRKDTWVERFGEEEIKEIKESLKNNFESLGDLILKFMEHAIEGPEDTEGLSVNLDDTANI